MRNSHQAVPSIITEIKAMLTLNTYFRKKRNLKNRLISYDFPRDYIPGDGLGRNISSVVEYLSAYPKVPSSIFLKFCTWYWNILISNHFLSS